MPLLVTPYPPASIRTSIPAPDWASCITAWTSILSLALHWDNAEFAENLGGGDLGTFLQSYISEASTSPTSDVTTEEKELRKKVFLAVHRAYSLLTADTPVAKNIPGDFLKAPFLSALVNTFPKSGSLRDLLASVWKCHASELETSFDTYRLAQFKLLESSKSTPRDLRKLAVLFMLLPLTCPIFLVGADWVDALVDAYQRCYKNPEAKEKEGWVLKVFYIALVETISTGKGRKRNWSLVSDILYGFISAAKNPLPGKSEGKEMAFLKSLVSRTPVLEKLRNNSLGEPEEARIGGLLVQLEEYKDSGGGSQKLFVRHRDKSKSKGKWKASEEFYDGDEEEVEILSKIAVIKDLFSDLKDSYIHNVLQHYSLDVEAAITALLEKSVPEDLLDNSTPDPPPPQTLPQRKNKYDNDDLDRLASSARSKLHIGRKNASLTADTLLKDTLSRAPKSKILTALAAFDSDEDERDDTYDVADVGGAVDTSEPAGEEYLQRSVRKSAPIAAEIDAIEKMLFETLQRDPAALGRDAETRRSKARAELKEKTGWSDEAIEGWKVMLERNAGRMRAMERRFADSEVKGQNFIEGTRWAVGDDGRGRGTGRGQGRGGLWRGGSGGSGSVSGSGEGGRGRDGPARGWPRRGQNSRRGANHDRREQHARKMARGGFGAP